MNIRAYGDKSSSCNVINEDREAAEPIESTSLDIAIFSSTFSHNLEVFISMDSSEKYQAFKNSSSKKSLFEINSLQKEGIALPLLEGKFNRSPFSSSFMKIYKYIPPRSGCSFDTKADKFEFCKVTYSYHRSCRKYELLFYPPPGSSHGSFKCLMFSHHVLPIIDFNYNGEKYRWIYENELSDVHYSYSLYKLDDSQISMTDDADSDRELPSENNPLGKDYFHEVFSIPPRLPSKDYSSAKKIAELKHLSDTSIGKRVQRASLRIINSKIIGNRESIKSLEMGTLVQVCFALVLIEQKEYEKRRNRSNGFMFINKCLSLSV